MKGQILTAFNEPGFQPNHSINPSLQLGVFNLANSKANLEVLIITVGNSLLFKVFLMLPNLKCGGIGLFHFKKDHRSQTENIISQKKTSVKWDHMF